MALLLPVQLKSVSADWLRWTALAVVLVYPVLEELVFRGFVQAWLHEREPGRRAVAGLSVANGAASVLFTAVHLLTRGVNAGSFLVFLPSLIFGWFRDRSGSVGPGMVLHVWYNTGFFLLFY